MKFWRAMVGLVVLASMISACAPSGAEVAFKGRCTDPKGHGLSSFTFSIGRKGGAAPTPVAVKTTTDGQYELQARVAGPVAASAAGAQGHRTLGPTTEIITLQVAAPGYKTKTFTVTANQIFLGEPNTFNVVLEPAS